jgi:hypothetical protein
MPCATQPKSTGFLLAIPGASVACLAVKHLCVIGASVNLRGWPVCALVILGSLVASPRRASADDEATEQARRHYQEGQKQFDLGHWDGAVGEFSKAYELRPDPNFLFNMAQAYRRGGNARQAVDLYKNYLIKLPKSPQRAEVEDRIKSLQRQLDDEEREAKQNAVVPRPLVPSLPPEPTSQSAESFTPPPAAAPAPGDTSPPTSADSQAAVAVPAGIQPTADATAPDNGAHPTPDAATAPASSTETGQTPPLQNLGSRPLRIAGVVTGAAGLVGIGAGIAFSVRTKSLSNSVSGATQFNSADASAGKQAAALQWVCYGVGGAAVVAGAILYWRGRARTHEPGLVSFVPLIDATNAGLLATGTF